MSAFTERIRGEIASALADLAKRLDGYEQTTHYIIHFDYKIEDVMRTIAVCWADPRPYTISNAAQTIEKFLSTVKGQP